MNALKPLLALLFTLWLAPLMLGAPAELPVAEAAPSPVAAPAVPPQALLITVLVPLLIALLKRFAPKFPAALLPVLAPVLGAGLDYALGWLGLDAGGTLTGAVAGGAGVALRETVDQGRKITGTRTVALLALFLVPLLFFNTGCMTREITRYTADGRPWSKERLSTVLMRGEAANVREKVTEKGGGDYTRNVSIGSLKGEGELDQLKELLGEVAERAATGAGKAVTP